MKKIPVQIIFKLRHFGLGLLIVGSVSAKSITTLDIAQKTLEAFPNCSQHKIIGACFWLECSWYGCWVNQTFKVEHYTPDAVVSVFNQVGQNPWKEADLLYDRISYKTGNRSQKFITKQNMSGGDQLENTKNSKLKQKEATIVGHPLSRIWPRSLFIRSEATPYAPYFESMLDAIPWRMGIESVYPQSLSLKGYVLGQFPLSIWGTVYPREGIIEQSNDAKAASVVAFRGAHIVTRPRQAHIYRYLKSGSCGHDCEVYEISHKDENHAWQMLSPKAETQCHAIAHNDIDKEWGLAESRIANGSYTWNLWRKYEGCIQGRGRFLFSVP